MGVDHHIGLLAGYGFACAAILLLARWRTELWPRRDLPAFRRPWLEALIALIGALGVIAAGQLWQYGLLLPETNTFAVILNQLVIFAPILAVPLVRRQGPETAWVRVDHWWLRLLTGIVLAVGALTLYSIVTRGPGEIGRVFVETYDPSRVKHIAQVLFEDVAIAILLVRIGAAIRRPWIGIVIVASLFAIGHIPALTADGASLQEFALLAGDIALGLIVLTALYRTQDILWLWPVHATLDLSQYVSP